LTRGICGVMYLSCSKSKAPNFLFKYNNIVIHGTGKQSHIPFTTPHSHQVCLDT
jgi:hypothetical protein